MRSLTAAIDQGRCRLSSGDGIEVLTVSRPDGAASFFAVRRNGAHVVDHASGSYSGNVAAATVATWLREDLAGGRRPWINGETHLGKLSDVARLNRSVPADFRAEADRVASDFAAAYDIMAEESARQCVPHPASDAEREEQETLYDVMRRAQGVSAEIVHNWPWAVPEIFDRRSRTFSPGPSARAVVAAAESVLRSSVEDGQPAEVRPGLLKAMEGLRGLITDENNDWLIDAALRTFNDLPPEWIPDDTCHDDEEEWKAAIELGHVVCELAEAAGRSPRSLIKRFPGSWMELASNFAEATGAEFDPHEPTFAPLDYCKDMAAAFERQVFEPAMRCAGVEVEDPFGGGQTLIPGNNRHVRAAVLRLLLGEKGLIGFGETAAKWHARVTDLAKAELAQCHSDEASWPVPFDRRQFLTSDGTPIEVRCLSSARQFLDEGADGPDDDGVEGLAHCIASYAGRARRDGDVVVSIRAVDEEGKGRRLSTAHFVRDPDHERFALDQHRGHDNDPPCDAAADAARMVEWTLRDWRPQKAGESGVFFDREDRSAVAAMISAWRFALPKAARTWTPEELVAASGLVEDPADMPTP